MSSSDQSSSLPYPVRLPESLKARLQASARRESRSLQAEILARLEASFAGPPTVNGLTAEDLLTRVDRYVASVFELHEQNQQLGDRLDEAVSLLARHSPVHRDDGD